MIAIVMICTGMSMKVCGQSSPIEEARVEIYHGYLSGDERQWERGLQKLQQIERKQGSLELKYEIALAQYGLIGFHLAKNKKEGLEKRLDETIVLVQQILDRRPDHAAAHALLGGLYGLKIGLRPARGIYLGPRSSKHIQIATSEKPGHPAGWVEMGNAKFHTPMLLGGSIAEAISCFSKAVSLFNDNPVIKKYNWLYLHALAWLAQAYEKESKYAQALSIYQKILDYEPNFRWVRDELLPALKSRMK